MSSDINVVYPQDTLCLFVTCIPSVMCNDTSKSKVDGVRLSALSVQSIGELIVFCTSFCTIQTLVVLKFKVLVRALTFCI